MFDDVLAEVGELLVLLDELRLFRGDRRDGVFDIAQRLRRRVVVGSSGLGLELVLRAVESVDGPRQALREVGKRARDLLLDRGKIQLLSDHSRLLARELLDLLLHLRERRNQPTNALRDLLRDRVHVERAVAHSKTRVEALHDEVRHLLLHLVRVQRPDDRLQLRGQAADDRIEVDLGLHRRQDRQEAVDDETGRLALVRREVDELRDVRLDRLCQTRSEHVVVDRVHAQRGDVRQELLEQFLEEVFLVRRGCTGRRGLDGLEACTELRHCVREGVDRPVAEVVDEVLELHVAVARDSMLGLQEHSDLPLEDHARLLVALLNDALEELEIKLAPCVHETFVQPASSRLLQLAAEEGDDL